MHLETGALDLSREDAEVIRAGLLNQGRKENSACVSNVMFTGANCLSEWGVSADSAGRDAVGAGSITQGFHTGCSPGRVLI